MWLVGLLVGIFHARRPQEGLYGAVGRTGRVIMIGILLLLIPGLVYGFRAQAEEREVKRQGAAITKCINEKYPNGPVPLSESPNGWSYPDCVR